MTLSKTGECTSFKMFGVEIVIQNQFADFNFNLVFAICFFHLIVRNYHFGLFSALKLTSSIVTKIRLSLLELVNMIKNLWLEFSELKDIYRLRLVLYFLFFFGTDLLTRSFEISINFYRIQTQTMHCLFLNFLVFDLCNCISNNFIELLHN